MFKAPLTGWNLVEASAGTGKTFSIALLALRLIAEKGMRLREILMVTFTKAATAELEARIRKFLREAKFVTEGRASKNAAIVQIVAAANLEYGEEVVLQRIKDALSLIDEKSIFTIHGFCKQVLTEFAVETRQYFQTELVEDISVIYNRAIFSFLRERVNTLPVPLLQQLIVEDAIPTVSDLQKVMKYVNDGKQLLGYNEVEVNTIPLEDRLAKIFDELGKAKSEASMHLQSLQNFIDSDRAAFKAMMGYRKEEKVDQFFENPLFESLGQTALKSFAAQPELDKHYSGFLHATTGAKRKKYLLKMALMHDAAYSIQAEVKDYKERMHLHTFNDFIDNLFDILNNDGNEKLKQALQERYKAVFVDEFQDTDEKQFRIFEKIYAESESVMYFIGDPKQSIYAFRGGDVQNYLKAKQKMENSFSMNTNYRSSEEMVQALNSFLLPEKGFDTFFYKDAALRIDYTPVNAEPGGKKAQLHFDGSVAGGISIFGYKNKGEIENATAILVQNLLYSGKYTIVEDGKVRPIVPGDIALLCRSNERSIDLQLALQRRNISSVIGKDKRILESEEAKYFAYLIEAIAEPKYPNIARAILSPFFGITIDTVGKVDENVVLNAFTEYGDIWAAQGAYPAMVRLAENFGLRQRLLQASNAGGEKVLANYYHLLEIVNRVSAKQNLDIVETAGWLYRAISNSGVKENEYLQRLETDEGSIRIETIHKSKGLEYKIVICPELDFSSQVSAKIDWLEISTGDAKVVGHREVFTDDEKAFQEIINEQENRRLFYVALTRAVSHLFIFKNTAVKNSTLAVFMESAEVQEPVQEFPMILRPEANVLQPPLIQPNFDLRKQHWARLSYSSIAGAHEVSLKEKPVEMKDDYENFIHFRLGRGNVVGTMLHEIFETIGSVKPEFRQQHINIISAKYAFVFEDYEASKSALVQLVDHALGAVINIGGASFSMNDVQAANQMAELEFDFVFKKFKVSGLQELNHAFVTKPFPDLFFEGDMNGKIDLFFEYNGMYYVLDWKSNYLGPNQSFYTTPHLEQAMTENNYHLQYYIYTLAVKKYLSARIANFDFDKAFGGVVYIFLRGARAGKDTGIYTRKLTNTELAGLENALL